MYKKILTNYERNRLVDAYERIGKAKILAEAYNVSERTVFRLVKQKNHTGSVELQTSKRGRKPKISENDLQRITETIIEEPDITLQEIIDKLHLSCTVPTICKIIRHKLGFTRKKKSIYAAERDKPEVQAKLAEWKEQMLNFNPDKLVFIDESGVNIDMTRLYGRSIGNTRIKDSAPINTPKRTGIVGAMRLDGTIRYRSFVGSITGKRFLIFLKQTLLPVLRKGDIVVMDNLSIHKVKGVKELILSASALPLYLPPYSPDLNPIEKLWSKLKTFLRKWKIRDVKLLRNAVKSAIFKIVTSDCQGWFQHSGYCYYF